MKSPVQLNIGFVPALQALPLAAHAREHPEWRMRPCASHGRIIRYLLTGRLDAGLLPWELCVAELLSKPAQQGVWLIPLIIFACPTELALTPAALHLVYPSRNGQRGARKRLTIGLEGRLSLTRHQVLAWLAKVAPNHLDPPAFRILPIDLMQKALRAEFIDGFVAPTPWGLQAALAVGTKADPAFEPGKFAQQVVLVCTREVAATMAEAFRRLPAQLASVRRSLAAEPAFRDAASAMIGLGHPHCDPDQLWQVSHCLHSPSTDHAEMTPDHAWFEKQFRLLAERIPAAAHLHLDSVKAALLALPS